MQRFIGCVRKKTVSMNGFAQGCAVYQIGVKYQSNAHRLTILLGILTKYLTGRQKYQSAFLIVVIAETITQIAALYLLQKNRIKAVACAPESPGRRLV